MDNLQAFASQVRWRLIGALLTVNALLFIAWWIEAMENVSMAWVALTLGLWAVGASVGFAFLVVYYLISPLRFMWQAILHLTPDGSAVPAPDPQSLRLGRELVSGLLNRVYQLASAAESGAQRTAQALPDIGTDQIASRLPLPLLVLDKNKKLMLANEAALNYLKVKAEDVQGKDLYSLLNMLFPDSNTLDSWLAEISGKAVTASHSWERVRLNMATSTDAVRLFDMAAYYNRDNPLGYELLLVLFDHTASYSRDDQALSFVSLAVHELRTSITLLRGYIEALEEDLAGKLPSEDSEFLERSEAAGQQLAAFVNNVLNVARVEDNQFVVQLHEEVWPEVIASVVADYSLRARLAGIKLVTDITPGLPTVGIDRLSLYEVLSNLLDNALKYTRGQDSTITIKAALTADGLVETTVSDQGIGVPASVIPHLFDKFYRSHRSRGQVGGTGLGLYLCKTIVTAHGGNIWVRSVEDQGSTFGFTLLPYDRLDQNHQAKAEDLTRTAYGWIKNHSLYRN